jgi:nucleoside-diphosphate-sugar epimerase
MKIFVAGATGVLGQPAVALLVQAGHVVTGIARREEAVRSLAAVGATPVAVDLFDPSAVAAAVAGHDAVLNLATHIPASTRAWRRQAWRENDRLRSVASRHLVDAALATGAGRYVQESVVFAYPDGGEGWLTEDTPADPPGITATTLVAEGQAARFTTSGGVGVALRFGAFYGAASTQTREIVALGRRGMVPSLGDPDAYISPIVAEDAAAAVVAALEVPAGLYNVTDDQPVTRRHFIAALGAALRRPPPRLVRGPHERLATMAAVTRSLRVSNRRFRSVSGWAPRYPGVDQGWPAVVAALGNGSGHA